MTSKKLSLEIFFILGVSALPACVFTLTAEEYHPMWIDNDFPKLLGAELYRPIPVISSRWRLSPCRFCETTRVQLLTR